MNMNNIIALGQMVRNFTRYVFSSILKWIAKNILPETTIFVDGKAYLTRYYVLLADWSWCNIYIHHFHMSDQKEELHSHPWKYAISYILEGGYREEVRYTGSNNVRKPEYKFPGDINIVKPNRFHRVDMLDLDNGAWTLFFTGRRIKHEPTWLFWNRKTKKETDWRHNPNAIP